VLISLNGEIPVLELFRFLPPATEAAYKKLEEQAKKQRLGIWRLKNYVKSYNWRHRK
jgi:endonuclease YncB( thermonuclease family)